MRFAYADPPYLGLAKKFYGDPTYDSLDAHRELIATLCAEQDTWAYSLHAPALKHILPLCPDDVRVMAWVKTWCSFKPGNNPAYAWEPVIVWRGTNARKFTRGDYTRQDWLRAPIATGKRLKGAKPTTFAYWIFDLLNAKPSDAFTDCFPGSGQISRAWDLYCQQLTRQEA